MNQPNREELVSAWIDGQLDAATAREVESLVASDPALRELSESLRDLSRQIRRLPARSLQRNLAPSILRQIREEAGSAADEPVERRSVTRSNASNPAGTSRAEGRGGPRRSRRQTWGWWISVAVAASLLGVAVWLPRGWQRADRDAISRADTPAAPATGASAPAAELELAAANTPEVEIHASKDGSAFKHGVDEEPGRADPADGIRKSAQSLDGNEARQSFQALDGQAGKMPGGFGGGGGGRGETGLAETGSAAAVAAPAEAAPSTTGQLGQSAPAGDPRRDALVAGDEMPGQRGGQVLNEGGTGRPGEEMDRSTGQSNRLESGEALADKAQTDPSAAGEAATPEPMSPPPGNFDLPSREMARGGGVGNDSEGKAAESSLTTPSASDANDPAGSSNTDDSRLEIVRIEFEPSSANWKELAGQLDPARTVLPEQSPAANEQDLVLFTGSEDDWSRLVDRLAIAQPQARLRFVDGFEGAASVPGLNQPVESPDDPLAGAMARRQLELSTPTVQFVGRFDREPTEKLERFQEQLGGSGLNQLGLLQDRLDQLGYERRSLGDSVEQSIPTSGQPDTASGIQIAGQAGNKPAPASDQPMAFLVEQSDQQSGQPAAQSGAGAPASGGTAGLALDQSARTPVRRLVIIAPVQLPAPALPAPAGDRN